MTTPHLTRKQLVIAKIESVYGTDPTPTGAANAMLVSNLDAKPLAPTMVKRDVIKGHLGSSESLAADVHSEISFEVEIAGSGTAGTAPKFGPLLRACGLSETIVASTSVTYAPISAAFESLTIYYYADGILHKYKGCRGTVSFDFSVKKIPTMKFTFTGLYTPPTDTTNATPDFSGFLTPKIVSDQNTTSFTFNGYSGHMSSLTMDVKNSVMYRTLVGVEYVQITDRQSGGTCEFELPSIADVDLYTATLNDALSTLNLVHGTVAGNITTLASAGLDLSDPSTKDDSGVILMSFPYSLVPTSAGNDEFSLAFT